MRPLKELDHTEWLKRIFELGAAAIAILTGVSYILIYIAGISSSADRANAKTVELEGRIDRQKDAIVDQRKVLDEVNQRTARIEGMVSTLVKRNE